MVITKEIEKVAIRLNYIKLGIFYFFLPLYRVHPIPFSYVIKDFKRTKIRKYA